MRHTKERMEMVILMHNTSRKAEQNLMRERVLLKPKGILLSNHKSMLKRVMLLEVFLQKRLRDSLFAEN